jgi:hypothetical protein
MTKVCTKKTRHQGRSTDADRLVGMSILSLSGFRICHISRSQLEPVLARRKKIKKLALA